jgi:DNA-binding transcriptional regulator YdaS (Cro superfamily)
MTLREWFDNRPAKITQEEFGRVVGLSQGRISQILANGTNDLGTALAIESATKGEVSVRDLLPAEAVT